MYQRKEIREDKDKMRGEDRINEVNKREIIIKNKYLFSYLQINLPGQLFGYI